MTETERQQTQYPFSFVTKILLHEKYGLSSVADYDYVAPNIKSRNPTLGQQPDF